MKTASFCVVGRLATCKPLRTTNYYLHGNLAGLGPDAHLFCIFDEFFTEIRMGDVDQGFSAFPRRFAFQQGCTVFGDDVVDSRTRRRDDRTSGRVGLIRDSTWPSLNLRVE